MSETKCGRGKSILFSESSLQDLFKNLCLVSVGVRVIKIFGTEDNCFSKLSN